MFPSISVRARGASLFAFLASFPIQASHAADAAPPSAPPSAPASSPAPAAPASPPGLASDGTPASEPAVEEETAEIVVAGTRVRDAEGSVHVIGQKQLARYRYDDVNAVLVQVPGVAVRQEDGLGLRPNIAMRGVNPDRSKKLTLLEDGILFGPAPYSAPAAYYFPLMARITQVRAIKGPAAIGYGPQTVAGTLDLLTRPINAGFHGMAELAGGFYGYNRAHAFVSFANEQVGFLIEGVRLGATGFKQLPDGADTGFTRNEWTAKASYLLNPRSADVNEFQLKLGYSDEASNETYLGLSDEDFRENPYQRYVASALDRMENHRTSIVLTHRYEAAGTVPLSIKTSAYRHDYDRTWRKVNAFRGAAISAVLDDPENPRYADYFRVLRGEADSFFDGETLLIGPNHRTFVSQGLQSVLNWKPKTGPLQHSIEAGARLHYDSIRRVHSQDAYVMRDGQLIRKDEATEVTVANFEDTVAGAVHLLDSLSWGPVALTPGVRIEILHGRSRDDLGSDLSPAGTETTADLVAILPGVGASYAITPAYSAFGGVHRGFSPPAPGSGSPPEDSINYEVGTRYQSGALRAEAIGFWNAYSNLTDICTLASGCLDENLDTQYSAGAADVYGAEAYLSYAPRAGEVEFPMSLAYTWTRGQFLSDFESADPIYGSVQAGDEVPYLPEHQVNVAWAIEGPRGGANLAMTYVAPMREVAGTGPLSETLATDSQYVVDLGAVVRPLGWLEVTVNLRNVLGAENLVSHRPYGARPNSPRWLQVGLIAKF